MKKFVISCVIMLVAMFAIACSSSEPEVIVESPAIEPEPVVEAEPTSTLPPPPVAEEPTAVPEPAEVVIEPTPTSVPSEYEGQSWVFYSDFGCNNMFSLAQTWTLGKEGILFNENQSNKGTYSSKGNELIITLNSGASYLLNIDAASLTGSRIDDSSVTTCINGFRTTDESAAFGNRARHTATLLSDNTVLIVGGHGSSKQQKADDEIAPIFGSIIENVAIFDPQVNQWADLGPFEASMDQEAIATTSQNVMFIGGISSSGEVNTESKYFNLEQLQFFKPADWPTALVGHSLIRMDNGSVLLAGGSASVGYGDPLALAKTFNLTERVWTDVPNMNAARVNHAATLLNDGRVLISGGGESRGEIYDPSTNSWAWIAETEDVYNNHSTALLRDGRVLFVGGLNEDGTASTKSSFYDPATNSWGDLEDTRTEHGPGHTLTRLKNGRVMLTGGVRTDNGKSIAVAQAEIFYPNANTWRPANRMLLPRIEHSATLLDDGTVLVMGGYSFEQSPYSSIERYDPESDTWTLVLP